MSYEANDDSFPGQAVAYIVATWGNQTYTSSGVLVGRNDVLTASHAIFDETLGGLADEVKVYFSYDPDDTNPDFYTPADYDYFDNYDPDNDGLLYAGDRNPSTLAGSELDIALLSLDEAAGDIYGWFDIDYDFTSGSVGVYGFPGTYDSNLTYDSGHASLNRFDNYVDTRNLEINSGNSGGPVFTGSGDTVSVVGLVSTSIAAVSVTAHETWLTANLEANDSLIETSSPPVIEVSTIEIFRFFDTSTGTHFYTGNAAERDTIIAASSALSYEGVAFTAADTTSNLSGLVNVFRLYNSITGTHFYTADENERANAVNNLAGFIDEGIAYYGYAEALDDGSSAALFRFYNEATGTHFYTASEAERDEIQTVGTLAYEGIAYYVGTV